MAPHTASASRSMLPLLMLLILASLPLGGCFTPQSKRPDIDQARVADEVQKQQEFVARQYLRKHHRVQKVAWPVIKANAPICDKVAYGYGLYLDTIDTVPKALRSGYAAVLGMDTRLTLIDVVEGTPAYKAGLQPGDAIVGVDGKALPKGKDAISSYTDLRKQNAENSTLILRIERNGSPLEFTLEGERVCGYPVYFKDDEVMNAYATGKYIMMQSGLLNILDSDDELAQIVAHELAHNSCGHIEAKKANAMGGALLGGFLALLTGVDMTQYLTNKGANAYSQDFEFEADYVGAYYTARAGYDITYIPDTWRKMSAQAPSVITTGSTHPANAERYVALEATVKEIRAKQAAGLELQPEFKGQTGNSTDAAKDTEEKAAPPAGQ